MGAERCDEEVLEQVRDHVRRYRVQPDDDEGEGPSAVASDLDHPAEGRQQQEAPAAAEQRPCRGPDALDDRIDARGVQQDTGKDPGDTGHYQAPHRNGRRGCTQPASGDEPEDHRAQRRDEAEREIAAAVGHQRRLAREQVQEPLVEGQPQVGVLVPVGRQPRVLMRPVRRYANGLVVVAGPGNGVQRPREPVSEEHEAEGRPDGA